MVNDQGSIFLLLLNCIRQLELESHSTRISDHFIKSSKENEEIRQELAKVQPFLINYRIHYFILYIFLVLRLLLVWP